MLLNLPCHAFDTNLHQDSYSFRILGVKGNQILQGRILQVIQNKFWCVCVWAGGGEGGWSGTVEPGMEGIQHKSSIRGVFPMWRASSAAVTRESAVISMAGFGSSDLFPSVYHLILSTHMAQIICYLQLLVVTLYQLW